METVIFNTSLFCLQILLEKYGTNQCLFKHWLKLKCITTVTIASVTITTVTITTVTIKNTNTKRTSSVQKIIVGSIYSKPNSRAKSKLLDHIAEVYTHMSTKHQQGLHWIICGDTNDLKIDSILHLSKTMRQVVNKPTRIDPVHNTEKVLDKIMTTLSTMYQEPQALPPLDMDPDKDGKPSDHNIVVMSPADMQFVTNFTRTRFQNKLFTQKTRKLRQAMFSVKTA